MSKSKYGIFSAFGELTTVIGKSAFAIGRLADASIEGAEMAVDTAAGARAGMLLDRLVAAGQITEGSKEALVALSITNPAKYSELLTKVLERLANAAETAAQAPTVAS
jgi:hypothetical protein